eukprot:3404970-Rhodomonas_salina.1
MSAPVSEQEPSACSTIASSARRVNQGSSSPQRAQPSAFRVLGTPTTQTQGQLLWQSAPVACGMATRLGSALQAQTIVCVGGVPTRARWVLRSDVFLSVVSASLALLGVDSQVGSSRECLSCPRGALCPDGTCLLPVNALPRRNWRVYEFT